MASACRKIWEAFLDNEVLLNGERVKKKSTSVRRVSVCLYHKVLGLREQLVTRPVFIIILGQGGRHN